MAGIVAPLKACPQVKQVPVYSEQTVEERNAHVHNKNKTTSKGTPLQLKQLVVLWLRV